MRKFELPWGISLETAVHVLEDEVNKIYAQIEKANTEKATREIGWREFIGNSESLEPRCVDICNGSYTGNPHLKLCPLYVRRRG